MLFLGHLYTSVLQMPTKIAQKCVFIKFGKTLLNALGSEGVLGLWRSFDMPCHLCFFSILNEYYWLRSDETVFSTNWATVICEEHESKS